MLSNLKDEVLKTLIPLAEKCQHTGGRPPLGYSVDAVTKKLVIEPNEAEAVRIIFNMYLSGYGYDQIAAYLTSKGYKTREGKNFGHNSFYDLLRNKKYCGYFVFNRASSERRNGTRNSHKEKDPDKIICIYFKDIFDEDDEDNEDNEDDEPDESNDESSANKINLKDLLNDDE